MSALVEFFHTSSGNVPLVPVGAVVRRDGKRRAAVKTPDGRIDWREVTVGLTDGKEVEVKEGLQPGDVIVRDPVQLLSHEERQKVTAPQAKGKAAGQPRAKGKSAPLPAALRAKLQSIPAEDRAMLRDGSPVLREAILKKAGFTDDEIKLFNERLEQAGSLRPTAK
jgi:hypothetical protein